MAVTLRKWDWSATARRIYPWEKWTNGKIWRLTAGEDFHSPPRNFRITVYAHAKHMGKKVRIATDEGDLVIQFYDEDASSNGASSS